MPVIVHPIPKPNHIIDSNSFKGNNNQIRIKIPRNIHKTPLNVLILFPSTSNSVGCVTSGVPQIEESPANKIEREQQFE